MIAGVITIAIHAWFHSVKFLELLVTASQFDARQGPHLPIMDEHNKIIEEFIYQSFSEKINKLIVVTGKGLHSQNEKDPYVSKNLSILKYSVPEFIENNKSLMNIINEIKDASIDDGGSGAFYIFLKKNKTIK